MELRSYISREDGLAIIQAILYRNSYSAGWWRDGEELPEPITAIPESYLFAIKMLLVHSELSEAVEGYRIGKMDDHLPHRKSVEVELGDAVIRILDLAERLKLDVIGAIIEKNAYNQIRADHKPENRAKQGGKKF